MLRRKWCKKDLKSFTSKNQRKGRETNTTDKTLIYTTNYFPSSP
jgi:hypothetical protein